MSLRNANKEPKKTQSLSFGAVAVIATTGSRLKAKSLGGSGMEAMTSLLLALVS